MSTKLYRCFSFWVLILQCSLKGVFTLLKVCFCNEVGNYFELCWEANGKVYKWLAFSSVGYLTSSEGLRCSWMCIPTYIFFNFLSFSMLRVLFLFHFTLRGNLKFLLTYRAKVPLNLYFSFNNLVVSIFWECSCVCFELWFSVSYANCFMLDVVVLLINLSYAYSTFGYLAYLSWLLPRFFKVFILINRCGFFWDVGDLLSLAICCEPHSYALSWITNLIYFLIKSMGSSCLSWESDSYDF